MGLTDNLRTQHKEMLKIISEISSYLTSDELLQNTTEVQNLLSGLAESMGPHLKREEEWLYPALLRHPDKNINDVTRQFQEGMGGLLTEYQSYINKWTTAAAVQNNSEDFVKETTKIFNVLAVRIDKEDNELFSLVDR